MAVYIISFVFNMLLGLTMCIKKNGHYYGNELNKNKRKRKWYLFITTIQFGLLCGFRSTLVGHDTGRYEIIFNRAPKSWEHIFDKDYYVEMGFSVLGGIIKILGGEFQTMLIITSLFVMGSCCIYIYRHSKNVVLSVFIIICFPFYYTSFDIIRHFLAVAFFLLGYKYIVEKKPLKFLFFILMGSLFQKIAWVFFLFYFVPKIKWNWKTMSIAIVGTALLFIYIEPAAIWISQLLEKGNNIDSGWIGSYSGGIKTAFMYGCVLLIAIIAYFQLKDKKREDMTAVNHVLLMLIFSILFINARMMTRMMVLTVALMAIAIPQLLDRERTNSIHNNRILKLGFIAIGCLYHVFMLMLSWQNVVPYVPYWK